jgi:hypothetical protein
MPDTSLPITGTVTDDANNPLLGVEVVCYRLILDSSEDSITGSERLARKQTDSNGVYEFGENDLPATHSSGATEEIYYVKIEPDDVAAGSGDPLDDGRFKTFSPTDRGIAAYSRAPNIPDENDLLFRASAQADSQSTGTISTIPDFGGAQDLSGTAELISNGINGKRTYRFDGVDDAMSVVFSNVQSQPNHIFVVYQIEETTTNSNFATVFDSASDVQHLFQYNIGRSSGEYQIFAGSGVDITSPNIDNSIRVASVLFDGSGSEADIDGNITSGDTGGGSLDGLTLASRGGGGSNGEVDIGEVLVYPQDKSGIKSDIINYLQAEWGL